MDVGQTATAFAELAEWAEDASPLYERCCREVADDPELLDLASEVPEGRATANVFLAAVHRTLFDHPDHPLGTYYPTVADDPRPPEDLGSALAAFCEQHAGEIRPLLRTRRTQTNSVRRSAALYPAVSHVARQVSGPLALVELGPSAGLNLLLDRYEYDYDGRVVGSVGSPVTIHSELRGERDPPVATDPPAIHSRVGIDRNPIDVTDPDDAAWLRALVWPDQAERHRALDAAIEVAREDPPRIVEGDLLADLPAVLEGIPSDVPVCVFDSLVLYQVPDEVRQRLTDTIAEYARERPLHWLAGEEEFGDHDGIRLEWTRQGEDSVETDLLAAFEQHGQWVEWRGE